MLQSIRRGNIFALFMSGKTGYVINRLCQGFLYECLPAIGANPQCIVKKSAAALYVVDRVAPIVPLAPM